jgi:hypothetical protein
LYFITPALYRSLPDGVALMAVSFIGTPFGADADAMLTES